MSIESLFRSAADALRARDVPFAVAGGLAADLYRQEPRVTMDIDLVILMESGARETAVAVVESLGLEASIAREADLAGGPLFAIRQQSTPPCIVVGRRAGDGSGEGVDILLPAIHWVADAVRRAQANLVDFGFGPVPALTVEDVVLSKLAALRGPQMRVKHIDDLQSIYDAGPDIDVAYLDGQMRRFGITVPREAEPFLDARLLSLSRDIVRTSGRGRKGQPGRGKKQRERRASTGNGREGS